ncbi:MAG: phage head closure protein, partial [Smithella sp.]
MKTSPSQFDKRITLQYPTRVSDNMGGFAVTWNDAATVWAKKTTHRSDEAVQAMATTGIQIHNFRIQFRTDVK